LKSTLRHQALGNWKNLLRFQVQDSDPPFPKKSFFNRIETTDNEIYIVYSKNVFKNRIELYKLQSYFHQIATIDRNVSKLSFWLFGYSLRRNNPDTNGSFRNNKSKDIFLLRFSNSAWRPNVEREPSFKVLFCINCNSSIEVANSVSGREVEGKVV
jgi:hypothetical protein